MYDLAKRLLEMVEDDMEPVSPYMEVIEGEEGLKISCELPEASAEHIRIFASDEGIRLCIKRSRGSVSHFFQADGTDPNALECSFVNGVLSITAPKRHRLY